MSMFLIGLCEIIVMNRYTGSWSPCGRKAYQRCKVCDEKYCALHGIHHNSCEEELN